MVPEDADLVSRARSGDRRAFEMLVARYEKPVFSLARRVVGDCDDAADITQNVFVKAYLRLETYNPAYSFFSWIYRIAVNESLNLLSSRKRRQSLRYEPPGLPPTPEDDIGLVESSALIQRALEHMTVDQRVVIVLKHLLLLPYREIAEILGVSEKTVKSRLYSARQLLKERLVEYGYVR
jgi:RNA polymerase sigma-70 factor (ECF subfamily)